MKPFGCLETCQIHDLPIMRTRLCPKILKADSLNPLGKTPLVQSKLRIRLRGMAKDWCLELPNLGHSRTNHGPGTIFKKDLGKIAQYTTKFNRLAKYCLRLTNTDENKTQQFVKGLKVELQWALEPLPPMGFVAAFEAATRTEMADQACGKPGHVRDQCPKMQQVPPETSRRTG
ncbi:hypothetical protein M9H77_03549 [Catharanthus roseus]|uniref:Uncharacterized protein n=1 Tax=Catharanthus roseus TaxID=4058 RepID=A0ACC0CBL8_CATRO|nr:hypothetical protein M9H77_03549 [Catharanthus roseus]